VNVVTLVPYRSDCGERDALWQYCKQRWVDDHPYWPIVVGHHRDGPFNRSAAINIAAANADCMYGRWDVAVIIDADIVCDPDTLRQGARQAHDTGHLFFGGRDRFMLSRAGTQAILAGYEGPWEDLIDKVHPDETMCCALVSRKLWDRVGGFDPLFVGYGYEDLAFIIAAETFTGTGVTRLDAPVWHLHHEISPENNTDRPEYQANRDRYKRYHAAGGNTEAIEALIKEAR
jgi:GT2 family glycosyltransferase